MATTHRTPAVTASIFGTPVDLTPTPRPGVFARLRTTPEPATSARVTSVATDSSVQPMVPRLWRLVAHGGV